MPIRSGDVLGFTIGAETMSVLLRHAKLKCLGGNSHIRGDDRQGKLLEDQVVGLIGTYMVNMMMFGNPDLYYKHMEETGDSWDGDGGTDLPGARVDVKTSMMRSRSKNTPMEYNLLVRPSEYHDNTTYILALVSELSEEYAKGYIVGWMDSRDIKPSDGTYLFGNAYVVPAYDLNPLPNFRWART